LVNAQKTIYLITLRDFVETREWKNQINLEAEQKRAHADTKVAALLVRVADPKLTKHVKALRKNVFDIANTVSRTDAEKLSVILGRNFDNAQRRIGELIAEVWAPTIVKARP
jgi:hypothetical protein